MAKLKLLVITSYNNPDKAVHAVDLWRSGRNIRELRKNVDWDITERPTIMKHIAKYKSKKDFTEEELEKTVKDLARYDIVYGSYTAFMHNMVFALCKLVEEKYGTKFVLDVDDNLFNVKKDNIGWWWSCRCSRCSRNSPYNRSYSTSSFIWSMGRYSRFSRCSWWGTHWC